MFDDIFKRYVDTAADRTGEVRVANTSVASGTGVPQSLNVLPPDLSRQISPWLTQVAQLAETHHVQSIATAVQKLQERWHLPGFRLAFVGEFSRGKSTLINRLLDRALLPVAVVPTTASITSIIAGEEDGLTLHFLDGHQETRPLEAASWHDLIADGQLEKNRTIEATVRVHVNHAWLCDVGIEMIDTPGAGDINDQRTTHILQVLSECDATIILISAAVPLSLTEKIFIEQEILGKHIPQVLVVVSMLDTISVEQRHEVLNTVRERLNGISPRIPMLPSYAEEVGTDVSDPLELIRQQIAGMAAHSDRQIWRSRQVAGRLADYLGQLHELAQQALVEQKLDLAQREAAHKKARVAMQAEASIWETIKLQFQHRRLQVDQEFCQQVNVSGDHMTKMLITDLGESSDPKVWWEQQFPFLLHRELLLLARASSAFFMQALTQDIERLHREVNKTFVTDFTRNKPNIAEVPEILPEVPDLALTDEGQQILFSRLGSSAAIILGYLLIGPIGSAISLALGMASEHMLKNALEEQRTQIKGEVINCVSRTLQEYTHFLSKRLQMLYEEVAQDIEHEQQMWLVAREETLKRAVESSSESAPWSHLAENAAFLQKEIIRSLE
jgi:small GTP-binding protein